jgi:hypothetical protein
MDSFLNNVFYTVVCVSVGYICGQIWSIAVFKKWLGPKD